MICLENNELQAGERRESARKEIRSDADDAQVAHSDQRARQSCGACNPLVSSLSPSSLSSPSLVCPRTRAALKLASRRRVGSASTAMAALTISVSTMLLYSLLALVLYALYRLYDLFVIAPRAFLRFWEGQGVRGRPYKFPLGQLPEIQEAADSDRIVEYASGMAKEFGLLQTQIVGPICHCVVYDPEVVKVSGEQQRRWRCASRE